MFNKQNFCHIASNNRNDVKVGVFVYKTTDDLATVSTSGYFNDKIIDINLHDLIIHEWHDSTDRTKVQRNVLCVIERTLDNVGTAVIKSKWEGDIEQDIADLQTYVDQTFVRKDGTSIMTGPLKIRAGSMQGAVAAYWDGVGFFKLNSDNSVTLLASMEATDGLCPATNNTYNLGKTNYKWKDAYIARVITSVINNGFDIAVPVTNQAETLALKSEVDTAANSGSQLTNKGVWYAKMYAATVVPTGAEYDGRNYADFSQTDINGDPIIVLYEGQSGAWVQTQTITPPADYNGYVTITSKIWDIAEQTGQQGGLVLWAFNTKTFTPYPKIISFEDAALTGTPTAPNLSAGSPNNQIVNKQSLGDALANHGTGRNVGDIFFTARTDNGLNGAVECNGATYNTTDFDGAQSIGELLEDGKVPYVSMADYATALAADGSVGVFGWDGTGNTTFKVPTLTDIFIETGTAAQVGDYIAPGLPNITGEYLPVGMGFPYGTYGTGALYETGNATRKNVGQSSNNYNNTKTIGFDASRSSSLYKNSVTTVQPNAVRYRAMIQLAISASDEAVATCTAVTSDVADLKDHRVIAFQAPTAENNYTWYRKYADGWVEQGGLTTESATGNNSNYSLSITLAVEMADNNYTGWCSAGFAGGSSWNGPYLDSGSSTTTVAKFGGWVSGSTTITAHAWEVKGIAA